MEKIALITDSCGDLTQESLQKHHMTMFPIRVIYKDREYLDKIDITSEEMYARLSEEVPSTSLPDFAYCEKLLASLKEQGFTHFIVITVSAALSGTHNAIRLMFNEHPEVTSYLFDTRTLGYPEGVIAMEAAKLIEQGSSFDVIIDALEDVRQRTHGYIALDTLEYLKKGGRIGKVTAALGELLSLRPIISSNDDGVLYTFTKARGKKKAVSKVKEAILSYLDKGPCRLWILQGDAKAEAEALLNELKDHSNILEISLQTVGPSMGVHTGPGVVGCAILEEK